MLLPNSKWTRDGAKHNPGKRMMPLKQVADETQKSAEEERTVMQRRISVRTRITDFFLRRTQAFVFAIVQMPSSRTIVLNRNVYRKILRRRLKLLYISTYVHPLHLFILARISLCYTDTKYEPLRLTLHDGLSWELYTTIRAGVCHNQSLLYLSPIHFNRCHRDQEQAVDNGY